LNIDEQTADADLLTELTQLARRILPNEHSAPVLLSSRSGRHVMRVGQLVIKVHGPRADDHELGLRLQLVSEAPFDEIWVHPRIDVLTIWPNY
jgi:hypothetical protein